MEFIRGVHNIRPQHHGCVVSVGNYDGIHLGHQQVIRSLAKTGARLKLAVAIISFEPHPMEFFVPDRAPPRLMTVREKFEAMADLGVDRFCCLRFDHNLANTEPEEFISNLLIEKLGARHIVVGDDFRFGRNRRGNFEMLHTRCTKLGVSVEKTNSFMIGSERVSSTTIRELLKSGQLALAARYLGREYSMSGRVVRGNGNASNWGFATANIIPQSQNPPMTGVFVAEVGGIESGRCLPAAASLGWRPTVGGNRLILEAHILDFNHNLYGKRIQVKFLKKLREEVKFSTIETMNDQIRQDIVQCRDYFGGLDSKIAS